EAAQHRGQLVVRRAGGGLRLLRRRGGRGRAVDGRGSGGGSKRHAGLLVGPRDGVLDQGLQGAIPPVSVTGRRLRRQRCGVQSRFAQEAPRLLKLTKWNSARLRAAARGGTRR